MSEQREHWTTDPGSIPPPPSAFEGSPTEVLTEESDADFEARIAEEAEQARHDSIGIHRGIAHQHLRDAATNLRLMDRAVRRLGEEDLFDVEFEGHEATYRAARAQIDVAMAALTSLIPKVGA